MADHSRDRQFEVTVQAMEAQVDALRSITATLDAHRREFADYRKEYKDDSRAHREALWRMIDRLNDDEGPAGAT